MSAEVDAVHGLIGCIAFVALAAVVLAAVVVWLALGGSLWSATGLGLFAATFCAGLFLGRASTVVSGRMGAVLLMGAYEAVARKALAALQHYDEFIRDDKLGDEFAELRAALAELDSRRRSNARKAAGLIP